MTEPTLDDLRSEENWLEHREAALTPQVLGELVTTEQTREEFVTGAHLLRLDAAGRHVHPQQLLVADTLNAGFESNALNLPRRSTKTASVFATVLGRCAVRDEYVAAFTMTTKGKRTRTTFRGDVIGPMERAYPDEATRPFTTFRGNGSERIEWPNGSVFSAETPVADSFRGGAYDVVVVDESGEAGPEQGEDLKGGILATFDTRPGAQIAYAGTPAAYRAGNLLWDAMHDPSGNRLVYGWPGGLDVVLPDSPTWDDVRPLVLASHPGIASGLTTEDTIHRRFDALGPERFAREYLGVFGDVGGLNTILRADKWNEAGDDGQLPSPPEKFGLAIAVGVEQPHASVVAAWRDEAGRSHGLVLQTFPTLQAIPDYLHRLTQDYGMRVAYDPHQANAKLVIDNLERARPKPRTRALVMGEVKTAAAGIVKDVHEGNLVHYRQGQMDEAARVAVRRTIGVGGFGFGRTLADDDITPLEALSFALWSFDEEFGTVHERLSPIFID
ncbi:hypothetical protein [Microbacterium paludicola]|uniref:hypothetical protein n=1 Tax=Microbacterium paludicola TaxID=300019 RepID=UPI0011A72726|nr:hypothetical protein [Microbacterium paludicola]